MSNSSIRCIDSILSGAITSGLSGPGRNSNEVVLQISRTGWLFCFIVYQPIPGGARGVMVIVIGNGHSDTSSNPGRD